MSNKKKTTIETVWVFCRYRRVKNSARILDAHDYGYEAWRFPVRKKRK